MSDWKKVVTSGSSPTLTEITGSGLRFLSSPPTVTDTSLAVLVQDGGNIKQYPQGTIAGVNTTYDADGNGIDQLGNGFIIDPNDILHSAIPHVSGAIVHALWQDPLSDNIHAARYLNNVYTPSDGIAINQIGSTDNYEVSSSTSQNWTGVNTLDSGGINANIFPITFTSSINAGEISSSGDATFTTANVANNLAGDFQPQVNSTLVSASVIQAGPGASVHATTGLGIEGTFVFNDLAFKEQIQLVYTGSHEFGGPGSTTSQSFTGPIEITAGATSSLGFFGDGSGLTGLTTSNIDYFQLSTGSGISGSGDGGYDLSTAREFSLQTNTNQIDVLPGFESVGVYIINGSITESNISSSVSTTTGVTGDKIASQAVTHSHFPNTIISDLTPAVTDLANSSIKLFRDPGAFAGNQLRATTLGYLNSHLVDSIAAQLNNNVGSVTTMSVSPLEGGTQINGLYLTISNPSTNPTVGIAGTATVNGTNWTASVAGADDQYLAFDNGGTGQGDLTASAASIFGTAFNSNAITIGGADGSGNFTDTVTIPGSLVVTNTPTMIQTDQFRIKDTLFHLGADDDTAIGDYGFKFGAALTSSNSLIYDSAEGDMGRFGMAYDLDASTAINATLNPTTKLNMIGVFSGSESEAALKKANQHGNIRIDQDREIYFYI